MERIREVLAAQERYWRCYGGPSEEDHSLNSSWHTQLSASPMYSARVTLLSSVNPRIRSSSSTELTQSGNSSRIPAQCLLNDMNRDLIEAMNGHYGQVYVGSINGDLVSFVSFIICFFL